jgi:TPR repeat protein
MTKERKFHCGIRVQHLVCPVCTSEEIAEGKVSNKDLCKKVALLQTQYAEIASDSRINCREIQSLQLELEAVKDNLKSDEEIDTHYLDMAIERAVHALEDRLLASERTTPPEQVQYIQAIRTDMMKLEAQVTACEGTSQRVVADAMHTMLEQLESIRKDNSLLEIKSEEQRQAFREEIEELQTDLGIVKRTMKNLPTQVQWNTETVKNLLGSFSTLERELDAKFAEYDSFIASQKEFNQDISSQVASNSQRLDDIEEALAKESNSPTAARLEELEDKLNSIAEMTPPVVAIATAVNNEHEVEQVAQLNTRIQMLEEQIKQLRISSSRQIAVEPLDKKGKEQEPDVYVPALVDQKQNTTMSKTQASKNNGTGPVVYDELAALFFGMNHRRVDWVAAQDLVNDTTHEDAVMTGFKALLLHPKAIQSSKLRKNEAESIRFWRRTEELGLSAECNAGNKWAQYVNGSYCHEVLQDYAKARHFYELAAEQGHAVAQNNLGVLYYHGHGVPQDCATALHFYELAAEQGHAGAQSNLGYLYDQGLGVTKDYAKARHFYELAAEQGCGEAQNNLGVLYYHGQGVTQDYAKARHFCELAAEQGYAGAQANLGNLYDLGHGVTQDYAKARHFYELAAEQGNAAAQNDLGNLYSHGHGVTQDYEKARHFYELAAEQGHAGAQANLGYLYDEGLGVTQDYSKARHFYELAAEQGYAVAQVNLGLLYEFGKGEPVNKAKARHFYGLAAAQGDEDAQKKLQELQK